MPTPAIFSKWTRASLRRLTVGSGLVVGSLACILVFLSVEFARAHDAAVDELLASSTTERLLDQTLQLLVDGETAQRGFMIARDPGFLEPYRIGHQNLPHVLAELGETLRPRQTGELFGRIEQAVLRRMDFTDQVVSLAQSGEFEKAETLILTREGKHRTDLVRTLVAEAVRVEEARVASVLSKVADLRLRMEIAFALLVLMGTGLGGGLIWSVQSHLKHAEIEMKRSEEDARRFHLLAESTSDLVRIHQLDGTVEYSNSASIALLGYLPSEMRQMKVGDLTPEKGQEQLKIWLQRALEEGRASEPYVHAVRRKDGLERVFETRLEFMRAEDGRISRFSTVSRDITERRLDEERLTERAERDELTGLYNRRAFLEKGAELVERCRREQRPAVLVYCDLDGLKRLNDSAGHEAGDRLIRDAGQLLQQTARETDLVARLGGDEFVVLGTGRDTTGAGAFRARLHERIEEYNAGLRRDARVAMSVGIAVLGAPYDRSLEELLVEADGKMYVEKSVRRFSSNPLEDSA